MVYVTEYESVYHTSESCTHLDLSVHRGTKTQVEQKRNEYGGKYHACERCGGDSALVYYTEKGDCYHSQVSCSGLKRTVRLVKNLKYRHISNVSDVVKTQVKKVRDPKIFAAVCGKEKDGSIDNRLSDGKQLD